MEKAPPTKRPRYDAAFRAEALRLASESRSTLAAARALNIDTKWIYAWQKAAQPPLPADPAEAAEVRALRAANKRRAHKNARGCCRTPGTDVHHRFRGRQPPGQAPRASFSGLHPAGYSAWRGLQDFCNRYDRLGVLKMTRVPVTTGRKSR